MNPLLLITGREIVEKLRSRAFLVVNLVLVLLILVATILPNLLGDDGPDQFELSVVGDDATAVAAVADGQAELFDVELSLSPVADEDAATTLLEDGELDAVLVGADRVLTDDGLGANRTQLLEGARRLALLDGALAEAGLDPVQRQQLIAPAPLEVDVLGEEGDGAGPDPTAIFVALGVAGTLYGLLIFYGQQIAQGMVQEKQSRVIEVLLSTVRPVDLLGGKLLGLGLLGLGQIALMALVAGIGITVAGGTAIEVPDAALPTVLSALPWFLLGYAFYASLFALAAAVVPRIEDLQTAMTVPILLLVAGFFLANFAVADPDGSLALVAALLPFSAPIAQPVRHAVGEGDLLTTTIAVVGVIASTAVIVPLAARVYAGASLATRTRVSFREALRRNAS